MLDHLAQDPIMAKVIQEVKQPIPLSDNDPYFSLIKAIMSQQISTKAADAILKKFLDIFPEAYPHPDILILKTEEELRAVGLSRQKSQYVKNIAQFFFDQQINQARLEGLDDREITKLLIQIKGVGTWTVEMLLLFSLHRPDVFPSLDLAIQQSMQQLYQLSGDKKQLLKEMEEVAESWRPYRSLASRFLWGWKRKNATIIKKKP